jgi:pectate disaccharide-lyase
MCTTYLPRAVRNYNVGSDGVADGNVVHDIGNPSTLCYRVHGIYTSHPRTTIVNNIAYRNWSWGLHGYHNPDRAVIANNLVFQNGQGGISMAADTAAGYTLTNLVVTNNVVMNNGFAWSSSSAMRTYGGIGSGCIWRNNLMFNNKSNTVSASGCSPTNTLSADPQFVNYRADGTGDYHLRSTSPAINAGTITGAPSFDADHGLRPMGGTFDIGHHEYGSVPGSWPW